VLALVASSCGGSGSKTYTSAATGKCLAKAGAKITGRVDFVASTALGGAFKATLPDHDFVTIAFGKTESDAGNIADAYRRFSAANVGINDVLREQGNAVMLWHEHPSDADAAEVTDCLKG
jgi:hypothetical protein